ncbi:MAG: alpha/beta hydrolase [Pseudomonadota bacterium]
MTTFQTKDGLTLTYMDEGSGPGVPLLCLAGLTRNSRDFDFLAEAIGPDRRMIRLDSRGRGASDHDPNFANYNVMVEAGDALALLDHLGIDRVVIIGSSRGGILGMVIAATAPNRLVGVVLNDVGPEIDPKGITKIMSYLGLPPQAKSLEEAAENMAAAFGHDCPGVDQQFWLDWVTRGNAVTADGLALNYDPKIRDATLAQAAEIDPDGPGLWPLFAALGPVKALVLRAENSDLLTAETVAKMVEAKPDLATAVVANRGHIPRLDEPDAIGPIRDFLASIDG